jgi:hypothetical protein
MDRSRITAVAAGLVSAFAGAGCHEEGPAERAGRAIDEAAKSAQESVQKLIKEDGPLEHAGEAADQAIDKAKQAARDALKK